MLKDYSALSFDIYGTVIDWETGILTNMRPLTDRLSQEMSDDEVLELHARMESSHQALTPAKGYSSLLATVYRR